MNNFLLKKNISFLIKRIEIRAAQSLINFILIWFPRLQNKSLK